MKPEIHLTFVVDDAGRARLARGTGATVETVEPGEYMVTLPLAVAHEFGLGATVEGGFVSATPGDESGNKPHRLRVITMLGEEFAPRDFTLVLRGA